MWINFLKISLRNLLKYKSLTLINVSGMAVALAACMLIGLYIYDELQVDQRIQDGDRIVRIATKMPDITWVGTPAPVSMAIKQDFEEVEASARLMKFPELDQMLLRYESGTEVRQFYESKGYYADSTFFDVVSFPMLNGDTDRALRTPSGIVLSDKLANRIFGSEEPLGKVVTVGMPLGDFDYTVTGVFDAQAANSHIDANFFLSMENQDFGKIIQNWTNWASNNIFYTYVKLMDGVVHELFEQKVNQYFIEKAAEDMKAMGVQKEVVFQPFQDIYLKSHGDYELGRIGNLSNLYIFGTIALFILLIACINFMNLTTARSERRAREVGIRKLLGANRPALMRQFLVESVMVALVGFIVAAALVSFVLPYFGELIGRNITGHISWVPWVGALMLCFAAGMLAGIYPAFFLSNFKPISVLKGRFVGRISGVSLREVLVVVQFCISACLILMVFVIKSQMNFVQTRDLGFDKDQQIVVPLRSEKAIESFDAMKNSLMQGSQFKSVTMASTYPGVESLEDMLYYTDGKSSEEVVHIRHSYVGNDFIETLGFELLAGNTFTEALTTDRPLIILNESAVRALGFEVDDAVGKNIHYDWRGEKITLEIYGVVGDFHFESLHKEIEPYGFRNGVGGGYLIAKFSPGATNEVLATAENVWKAAEISEPFTYSFLDQDFQRNYEREERTAKIIISFAFLALFIACLGLYGLTAFMTELKTKEIGIRKTLGASDWSIVSLLSKDIGKTVLLAIAISVPIGFYLSKSWLANFAFQIEVAWWYYLLTGLAALGIAMLTVSFQSVKAAMMNPVESLKSE
ncbi:ABC transporter permease [Algoriphagus aestuariicola]|uniref:ABC transporter permease n=1 Tax=Algoriphagus aestuariicola TaxID=1852016 RepID=A0ABS3BN67_9BACT|nr:FtsX-like permease family protein [Algoriphagus aestuariicola]MBN7800341.1 ABC transporter permease [Algoriphagus aestuariicola]